MSIRANVSSLTVSAWTKRAVILAVGAALFLGTTVAGSVAAQASTTNEDTISVSKMSGFPTERELMLQAEGRIGDSATPSRSTGDWELGVGTSTQSPETSSMEQFAWKSNKFENFTVVYDGNSMATFTVGGTSTSYNVGQLDDDSDLYILGKREVGFVVVNNLRIGDRDINEAISPGIFNKDAETIKVSGADLSEGFTLSGSVRFTFLANSFFSPTGSKIDFQVQVRGDEQRELRVGEKATLGSEMNVEGSTYQWQVSDKRLVKPNQPLDESTLVVGPAPKGEYTATLTTTDKNGDTTTKTYDITIVTPSNSKKAS